MVSRLSTSNSSQAPLEGMTLAERTAMVERKMNRLAQALAAILMAVVLGGIGLPGGAVYIERHLLKSRGWDTWVSLAGPSPRSSSAHSPIT